MIFKSSVAFQCCANKQLRRFGNLRYTLNILIFICILISLFLLMSCKDTTSGSYDETRINEILYSIESAFNDHDIDALMQYFDINYLHNGQSKWEIREVWLDRMAEYLLIDFQSIEIDVQNGKAIVSFRMKLSNSTSPVYSEEPLTHGDLSYFIYDNSDWKVFGNQENSK
jgi:hypothetical protein